MIEKELLGDKSIDATKLNRKDNYSYSSYTSNDSNKNDDNCLGPKDLIFSIPLQIENWFVSLDKENQRKAIKNFEIILKNN